VQFSSANFNAQEGSTGVRVTVNRIGDTSGPASVDYSTANGTASDRADYTTAVGRLSFAPGETSKTFPIFITDDLYVEGNETFNVALTNASGVSLGSPSSALFTIIDNDSTPPTTNPADRRLSLCGGTITISQSRT
jgi:hypothetical protein